MAAYEWLSENYKEGDRIYLFGSLILPSIVFTSDTMF